MVRRVMIGNRGGVPGIFVSRPGTDVVSENELMVDSQTPLMKPVAVVQFTQGRMYAGYRSFYEYAHGLGYVPQFLIRGKGTVTDAGFTIDLANYTNIGTALEARATSSTFYLCPPVPFQSGTRVINYPSGAYIEVAFYNVPVI